MFSKNLTMNFSLGFFFIFRQLVEQIMSDQQNAKEAKKKLKEYKQKIGKLDPIVFGCIAEMLLT